MILLITFIMWYIAISYIWAGMVQNTFRSSYLGFGVFIAPSVMFAIFVVLSGY